MPAFNFITRFKDIKPPCAVGVQVSRTLACSLLLPFVHMNLFIPLLYLYVIMARRYIFMPWARKWDEKIASGQGLLRPLSAARIGWCQP